MAMDHGLGTSILEVLSALGILRSSFAIPSKSLFIQ